MTAATVNKLLFIAIILSIAFTFLWISPESRANSVRSEFERAENRLNDALLEY